VIGEGGLLSASFVGTCVSGFSTREQLHEVEAFLEGKKGKGVEVSL
jgi:aminopeptidase 2